jgi:hypothetical protein
MLQNLLKISALLLAICFSMHAEARTVVFVSEPPAAREMVVAPEGYENCYVVGGGWYRGVWVHKHRVCQYKRLHEGSVWVDGYWRCDRYNHFNGHCKHWQWVRSHWSRESVVY